MFKTWLCFLLFFVAVFSSSYAYQEHQNLVQAKSQLLQTRSVALDVTYEVVTSKENCRVIALIAEANLTEETHDPAWLQVKELVAENIHQAEVIDRSVANFFRAEPAKKVTLFY